MHNRGSPPPETATGRRLPPERSSTPDTPPPEPASSFRSGRLEGWKAIGKHFEKTERTVRKWERNEGLPVERLNGRIYALEAELDAWYAERVERTQRARAQSTEQGARRRRALLLAGLLAAALLAAVLLALLPDAADQAESRVDQGTDVARWRLRDGLLSTYGRAGEHLLDLEVPETRSEAVFGVRPFEVGIPVDVDDDGTRELLVDIEPVRAGMERARLLCVDSDRLLWEFPYGRRLVVDNGARTIDEFYMEARLEVLDSWDPPTAVIVSHHHRWFPSQVAMVDLRTGSLVAEYLHPGFIYDWLIADLEGDETPELLLGGTNNPGHGPGHAFFAVLALPLAEPRATDPRNYFGPDNGGELHYLLFPRPDVFAAGRSRGFAVRRIETKPGGTINLLVGQHPNIDLVYTLNRELRVLDVRVTDGFSARHRELFLSGRLDHQLSEDEGRQWRWARSYATAPDGNSPEVIRDLEARTPQGR